MDSTSPTLASSAGVDRRRRGVKRAQRERAQGEKSLERVARSTTSQRATRLFADAKAAGQTRRRSDHSLAVGEALLKELRKARRAQKAKERGRDLAALARAALAEERRDAAARNATRKRGGRQGADARVDSSPSPHRARLLSGWVSALRSVKRKRATARSLRGGRCVVAKLAIGG